MASFAPILSLPQSGITASTYFYRAMASHSSSPTQSVYSLDSFHMIKGSPQKFGSGRANRSALQRGSGNSFESDRLRELRNQLSRNQGRAECNRLAKAIKKQERQDFKSGIAEWKADLENEVQNYEPHNRLMLLENRLDQHLQGRSQMRKDDPEFKEFNTKRKILKKAIKKQRRAFNLITLLCCPCIVCALNCCAC